MTHLPDDHNGPMKVSKHRSRPSPAALLLLIPTACSIAGPLLLSRTDHGFLGWLWLFVGLAWLWIGFLVLAAVLIEERARKEHSTSQH